MDGQATSPLLPVVFNVQQTFQCATNIQHPVQAAAAGVPEEAGTQPGEWPGIYACDHRKLLAIYAGTLRARLAALKGDLNAAEVTRRCLHGACQAAVPTMEHGSSCSRDSRQQRRPSVSWAI